MAVPKSPGGLRAFLRRAAVPTLIAAVTAPLLLATGPADAASTAIDTGSLTWGVRQSWRTYVTPENTTPEGGATADAAGIVTFPLAQGTFDDETGATVLEFDGSVHYVNHCGHYPAEPEACALDLTLSDLRLVIDAERQTLSARVQQRRQASGSNVPPVEDLGVVDLADLDLQGVEPETGAGTTAWNAVPSTLNAAAQPVFSAYQTGAQMDPVTVVYEGPGGLPVFDEQWTEPGTVLMEQTAAYTDTGSWAKINHLFPDETNGVVHVVNDLPPAWTAFAEALDADTLQPVGDSGAFGTGLTAGSSATAFDPATATIYTLGGAAVPEVWALSWDPAAKTYTPRLVDSLPADAVTGSAMAWDPGASRLYLRVRTGGAQHLYAWQRTGDGWDRTVYPLPQVEGWNIDSYYSEANAKSLAVLGDGSLLVGRRFARTSANQLLYDPTALRISFEGDAVAFEEVAGSGTNRPSAEVGVLATVAVAVEGDRIAIVKGTSTSANVQFGSLHDDSVAMRPALGLEINASTLSAAFDPGSDLLWVKNHGSGAHVAIDAEGTVRSSFTVNGGGFTQPIAVTSDHGVITAWRDAGSVPGTARFDRAAVSPGITAHPADAAVTVAGPDGTAEAVFEAAADQEAEIRWQSKAPDALAYSDIGGASEEELRTSVDASHDGWLFRAVFANAAGAIATEPAELRVTVEEEPTSAEPSTPATQEPTTSPSADPSQAPSSPVPTTSPEEEEKPSVPMPDPTSTPPVGNGGNGGGSDGPAGPKLPSLPVTGASTTALLAAAAGLLGTGGILIAAMRRRRAARS